MVKHSHYFYLPGNSAWLNQAAMQVQSLLFILCNLLFAQTWFYPGLEVSNISDQAM